MAPPSTLSIATRAVERLQKEEVSYREELAGQEAQAKKLEDGMRNRGSDGEDDGNQEFMLKQQKTAIEQTKAVFEPLRKRLTEAIAKLEEQIESSQAGDDVSEDDVRHAQLVLEGVKKA